MFSARTLAFVLLALVPRVVAQQTLHVDHPVDVAGGSEGVLQASLSRDGRLVAYLTSQPSAPLGDLNTWNDVYLRDVKSGGVALVSVTPAGAPGNGASSQCALSADGRFVVFASEATDLVPGDVNGKIDVFVRDMQAGHTELVSLASDGSQADRPSEITCYGGRVISDDGRFVVFDSRSTNLAAGDTNWDEDVFVRDRQAGLTERVSVASDGTGANLESTGGVLSADGSIVAFRSWATNLCVPDTNPFPDVFVRDRVAGTTSLASVGQDGLQAYEFCWLTAVSADGRFVLFDTAAAFDEHDTDTLRDAYVRDLATGQTSLASPPDPQFADVLGLGEGPLDSEGLSDDGRLVLLRGSSPWMVPGDSNQAPDVFVHDRIDGSTVRANLAPDATQLGSSCQASAISGDGRVVGFVYTGSIWPIDDQAGDSSLFLRDSSSWRDLGHGLALFGPDVPVLHGYGELIPGGFGLLQLGPAWASGPAVLIVGADRIDQPFKGGLIVPQADFTMLLPDVWHGLLVGAVLPPVLPSGAHFYAQVWIKNAWSPVGWSATNAVEATLP